MPPPLIQPPRSTAGGRGRAHPESESVIRRMSHNGGNPRSPPPSLTRPGPQKGRTMEYLAHSRRMVSVVPTAGASREGRLQRLRHVDSYPTQTRPFRGRSDTPYLP